MNVLILAINDWSGSGYSWYEAINKMPDHAARMVCWHRHLFNYGHDLLGCSREKLEGLVEWADVLNVHDDAERTIPEGAPNRPVVMTYHGSWYRKQAKARDEWDNERGYLSCCLTVDLARHRPVWIGRAMPDLSEMWKPRADVFRVSHSPTNRWAKGTNHVIRAMSSLSDVQLDMIEAVSNNECLRRKAKCHLYVGRASEPSERNPGNGYGTNALEAWSLGMPVMTCALRDELRSAIIAHVGYLPFFQACSTQDIAEGIERFRDDEEFYAYWQRLGREYVRGWHNPLIVGRLLISLFEQAISEGAV